MGVKKAGTLILGGGLIAAVLNFASAVWPAQVSSHRASYPLTACWHVAFQLGFAAAEIAITVGFVATLLKGPAIPNRLVKIAAWALPVAFATFVVAELVEATLAHRSDTDAQAILGPLVAPASLLYGLGAVVAGLAVLRRRRWGSGSWPLLASGVALFVLVLPSQFGSSRRVTDLALFVWDLTVAIVGAAVARAADVDAAAIAPILRGGSPMARYRSLTLEGDGEA